MSDTKRWTKEMSTHDWVKYTNKMRLWRILHPRLENLDIWIRCNGCIHANMTASVCLNVKNRLMWDGEGLYIDNKQTILVGCVEWIRYV